MFGFKTRKRLRKEIVSMRREYDRLNKLLIRRTTALTSQEKKASVIQGQFQQILNKAAELDEENQRLAQIIIQASLGKSKKVVKAAATRLLQKFPQLGPPKEQ